MKKDLLLKGWFLPVVVYSKEFEKSVAIKIVAILPCCEATYSWYTEIETYKDGERLQDTNGVGNLWLEGLQYYGVDYNKSISEKERAKTFRLMNELIRPTAENALKGYSNCKKCNHILPTNIAIVPRIATKEENEEYWKSQEK